MIRRLPWLTIAVFAVTGAVTAAQLVWPQMIALLERAPTMITGWEVWRFSTAWLVQSDGWPQIWINFPALAVIGAIVERSIGRLPWAAAYITGGLAGEIAGVFWQPVGGGNSVAICGLIGLLAAFQLTRTDVPMFRRLLWPELAVVAVLYLCAKADIHGLPIVFGAVAGLGVWALQRSLGKATGTGVAP